MTALEYLVDLEWSMGHMQCPDCCGVSPQRTQHAWSREPSSLGHAVWCPLADAIDDLGLTTVRVIDDPTFPHMTDPNAALVKHTHG